LPTLLEDEHDQAVGRSDRQQVGTIAFAGTTSERNAIVSSTKLKPST
jgi:hypothetical protein